MKNSKINDTLAELMVGIGVSGVLIQIAELIVAVINPTFAGSRFSFALGLWIGVATALALSVHMYHSIDRALDMQPEDAEGYMRKAYLLRTAAILLVAAAVHFLDIGYVMATFLGVLTLKFGAFLQPAVHLIRKKIRKIEEEGPESCSEILKQEEKTSKQEEEPEGSSDDSVR